ncbi:PqqD family protein [Demequina gelatinilytica]|uniref:PqqD family protein n=1 Tax=Demequina gelatinilytica TaxID=1638980 RepID=UPI000AC00936|nr:PqqD family protein [Demequina gelatinilytica]
MSPAEVPPVPALMDDARVRSVWDDAIERDGQMLVLAGNEVSLLSPVATELVRAAREDITVAELGEHLAEVFGAPPGQDPAAAVREFLAALLQRGVIEVD